MYKEMPISLHFQIYRGDQLIQSVTLQRSSVQIGSLASSHVRIDDPSISRIHAMIEKREGQGLFIQDLGSEQGTWVNGNKVEQALLQPGDTIKLGNILVKIEFSSPKEQPFVKDSAATFQSLENPSMPNHDSSYATSVEVCAYFDQSVVLNRALRNAKGGKQHEFSMGKSALATLPVLDKLPMDPFPIVRGQGSYYELLYTSSMEGEIEVEGVRYSLKDWVGMGRGKNSTEFPSLFVIPIQNNCRIQVRMGAVTLVITPIRKVKPLPIPIRLPWELIIAVVAAFLLIILAVWLNRPIEDDSNWRFIVLKDKNPELLDFLPPPPVVLIDPNAKGKKGGGGGGAPGTKAKGKEGKMGDITSKKQGSQVQIKGPKDNPEVTISKDQAKEQAKDLAQKTGIIGILKENQQNGSVLNNVFSQKTALGQDAKDVLANLQGANTGENSYGVGGLGLVGVGPGGGGSSDGTIGVSNFGTVGKGSGGNGTGGGNGDGNGIGNGKGSGPGTGGYGARAGLLKTRKASAPEVALGTAEVKGGLDKEQIRRVIRRHMNEVKFCYEQALIKNNSLTGRIMIRFIISGVGKVSSSIVQSSTMGNPSVEQCVAQAVRRWDFPAPMGGGIVDSSYPFVFHPASSE